ncbi:MAG: asparagine synthase (glutamine-hydrolyzing) [Alphaproteobacteria bacterium]|nr:asparagine synthase (glutamine-hydrolyzing) [Alphaproteobacteria bacterium]
MCGIVSHLSWQRPVALSTLKRGADALVHRGPDGEGFWVSPGAQAGLGHRRLSIIDLETGAQPLVSSDGNIAAVVNGEFYGYKDIRDTLKSKGHVFKTQSDSEILLALYAEYGTDCLQYLRGEFAFVLWDERKCRLFAARDRFGIKPLCYTRNDNGLFLASEAKALFAMGIPAAWDEYAFFHAASLQYTPQDRTLFKDIFQLKPGHALLADENNVKTFKYWDLDYPEEKDTSTFKNESEAIEAFRTVFEESVRLRLKADVPVCFHLSGGLDSSAALGAATHLAGKKIPAFTVSFTQEGYDEFTIAEETAKYLDADFHPVKVTQEDIVREMPNAVWHGEGLAINGHLTAKYLLNKAICAAGYKVALTGEGADEALAGYPHLRADLFRMNGGDLSDLQSSNTVSAGVQLAHGKGLSTSAVTKALGFTPAFLEAKASMGLRMRNVLSDDYMTRFTANDCYADFMQESPVTEQLAARHPVNQSSWLWTKTALANYILRTLGDGMEMAQSIEGRLPFLDHHFFAFCRSLPMNLKIKDGIEKYILREAAKPYLTQTVYTRQKHPFMAPPVSRFSDTALMSFVRDTVASQNFKSIPFYDSNKATNLLDSFSGLPDTDRAAQEPVLMMMLTTSILQERIGL